VTPLSIVHTESSLGWGGQEIRILGESQGLARRGHRVRVLCPAEARIFAEAGAWRVSASALPIARKNLAGVRALAAWFRENACDVVNTHSSTDAWLAALALRLARRAVPMVRTRHISAAVPRNALSRWLYRHASAMIVTTGEALRRQLIEANGVDPARVVSVPTGVDAARFRPGPRGAARAALGLRADRFLVGIVATLRSWKGHGPLIEALAALPVTFELAIVGDGPMRETLRAQVAALGLGRRVHFAGNQEDVVPWLHAFDVFALPSTANEGVPQALVQAMLCALPCVTTTVGSIAELATHDATALVVAPRDAHALAAAIRRLAAGEGLRRELGEAARRHCVENFSYARMLDQMEAIFEAVVGHGATGLRVARR
jgi:glycosyltransferase involved in cell wall biosynthesis